MPGGIGSSGLKYKSISSIRGSLSKLGIGDGEKDSISALELSETISSDGRGDELSYNNLLKVVKQASTSQPFLPLDSLGFGTRFSTRDIMNSSDSVAEIVSRCSSPILRESTGSVGVTTEYKGSSDIILSSKEFELSSSSSSS
nr:hypothetical protein [Tanacetum cinerariifolium]